MTTQKFDKLTVNTYSSRKEMGEFAAKDIKDNPNLVGFDYLFDRINEGLEELC